MTISARVIAGNRNFAPPDRDTKQGILKGAMR
jgi:hypothetical protein